MGDRGRWDGGETGKGKGVQKLPLPVRREISPGMQCLEYDYI